MQVNYYAPGKLAVSDIYAPGGYPDADAAAMRAHEGAEDQLSSASQQGAEQTTALQHDTQGALLGSWPLVIVHLTLVEHAFRGDCRVDGAARSQRSCRGRHLAHAQVSIHTPDPAVLPSRVSISGFLQMVKSKGKSRRTVDLSAHLTPIYNDAQGGCAAQLRAGTGQGGGAGPAAGDDVARRLCRLRSRPPCHGASHQHMHTDVQGNAA